MGLCLSLQFTRIDHLDLVLKPARDPIAARPKLYNQLSKKLRQAVDSVLETEKLRLADAALVDCASRRRRKSKLWPG